MSVETAEQKNAHWRAIRAARSAVMTARIEAEEELRLAIEERVSEAELVLTEAIIAGFDSGLSQSSIGRAYGTKDYRTIKAFLERAERRRDALAKVREIEPDRGGWVVVGPSPELPDSAVRATAPDGTPWEFELTSSGKRVALNFARGGRGEVAPIPEGSEWIFDQIGGA